MGDTRKTQHIKMVHIISKKLLEPFSEHFLFFISFFVLATLPRILFSFFYLNYSTYALLLLIMHCIVLSYIVSFLVAIIKWDSIQKLLKTIIIIFFAIGYSLNIYCLTELGCLFDADLAILIMNTNQNEAKEFISTMVPLRTLAIVVGSFFVLILFEIISKKHNINLGHRSSKIATLLLFICLFRNIYGWKIWEEGPIRDIIQSLKYEVVPKDLKECYSHPKITFTNNNQKIANIVLIIGESFARYHSSIYGYTHNTNPKLHELQKEGMLYSFDSIISPAPTTTEAIKYMLSTYSLKDKKSSQKWYEFPSIIEIMQKSGYNCYWFSNQAKGGIHDASSRAFAGCCDGQWFSPKGHERLKNKNLKLGDIILVDSTYQFVNQLKPLKLSFIVYHMMGSHTDYRKRYPDSYSYFSSKDYSQEPQNHREILAAYDNSILYNDFVVEQIIDLFKQKDAIVIYLPDHGQVMYRDKRFPNYYAHGRKNDPISASYGVEIPFFVYVSATSQKNNPEIIERIKYRQNHPKCWNSDDLPYLIMDIIGIQKMNGIDVHSKYII